MVVVTIIVVGLDSSYICSNIQNPVLRARGRSPHETQVLRLTLFFLVLAGGIGRPSAYHPTRHFPPCM